MKEGKGGEGGGKEGKGKGLGLKREINSGELKWNIGVGGGLEPSARRINFVHCYTSLSVVLVCGIGL